jgi:glycosyltransferase involved in cell wall biosynthesis
MNIVMMTNTYTPLVGGIERSIKDFAAAFRRRGHRVIIVAPTFQRMPQHEHDVIRVPAIRSTFHGSAFSVALPSSPRMIRTLTQCHPDIIHSHQPFLLGNTALRLAHTCSLPLVYTHHVRFERYTHYLPLDSPATERFMTELSTSYANLSDQVFAPSESVAAFLRERGVRTPIATVPTGVPMSRFSTGDGLAARRAFGIPRHAFLAGHIGRLAPEKNLAFLAQALARFLRVQPRAHCFIAGRGPCESDIRQIFQHAGVGHRLRMTGILGRQQLVDMYHAMDVFAFSSKSETQGIVLVEAMAAGTPVVALDASGVREVVTDGQNGRLLQDENVSSFADALQRLAVLPANERRRLQSAAKATAADFSMARCAERALRTYEEVRVRKAAPGQAEDDRWAAALRRVRAEWDVFKTVTRATGVAFRLAQPTLRAEEGRPDAESRSGSTGGRGPRCS